MPDSEYEIPDVPAVTAEDIEPGTDLFDADLTDADLQEANLTDADLQEANLTDADLRDADLTGANLRDADLTGAVLLRADLPDADLTRANLPGADLKKVDLTEADLKDSDLPDVDLKGADLSGADLRGAHLLDARLSEVDLTGVIYTRNTQIDAPGERIENEVRGDNSPSEEEMYDSIARANHELRTAYSANGLIGRARKARVRERRARRKEAFAEGMPSAAAAWFGSILSKVFTGYGVQLHWVAGIISILYLLSAVVYHFVGEMSVGRSLYYSVVTLTTAPPARPSGGFTGVVAGIETFAGTAAVVFLGYVLGTRERV
jgi:hypothetical protein